MKGVRHLLTQHRLLAYREIFADGNSDSEYPRRLIAIDNNIIRSAQRDQSGTGYSLNSLEQNYTLAIPGDVIIEISTNIRDEQEFLYKRGAARKISRVTPVLLPDSTWYFRWLLGNIGSAQLVDRADMFARNIAYLAETPSYQAWQDDPGLQQWNQTRVDGYAQVRQDYLDYFQDRYGGSPEAAREDCDRPERAIELLDELVLRCFPSVQEVETERLSLFRGELRHYGEFLRLYQRQVFSNRGVTGKNDRGDIDIIAFATQSSSMVGGRPLPVVTHEGRWERLSAAACADGAALVRGWSNQIAAGAW